MKLHLPSTPTFVYTCSLPQYEPKRWRMTKMLTRLGFSNWQFVYGEIGPIAPWIPRHVPWANIVLHNKPPFLILEDDCTLTEDYAADIEYPDDAELVSLGGSSEGWPIPEEKQKGLLKSPGVQLDLPPMLYEEHDENWIRIRSMTMYHAALFVNRDGNRSILSALMHDRNSAVDVVISNWIYDHRAYCRKQPFWYQSQEELVSRETTTRHYYGAPRVTNNSTRRIDLAKIPCVVLTVAKNTVRHGRVRKWLSEHGITNVTWKYGRETENHHLGAAEMAFETLRQITTPCLWIEDDSMPTENFKTTVDVPADAEVFYLGGHCEGRSKVLGGMFPTATESLRYDRPARSLYYDTANPNIIRILSMFSGHGILWLNDETRMQFARMIRNRGKLNYDESFATHQWQHRVYGLRHPYLYQHDVYNDAKTRHYCQNSMESRPVLLTSCVFPKCKVAVANPLERLAEVVAAVLRWRSFQSVSSVIVADASGFMPKDLKHIPEQGCPVHWIATDLSETARRYGKGRAEAELIRYALTNSDLIGESFFKCTGRLVIENFQFFASEVQRATQFAGSSYRGFRLDTKFFFCTRTKFREALMPCECTIDDKSPNTFIENVYDRALPDRFVFATRPIVIGRSATGGNVYARYYLRRRIAKCRNIANRLIKS